MPTLAFKLNDSNAVGISLNLAYQTFAAKGLQGFAPFSSNAAALTAIGHDSIAWGTPRLFLWAQPCACKLGLPGTTREKAYPG